MGAAEEADPMELEDKYHCIDDMKSISVIEHETKYLDLLVQKYASDADLAELFSFRKESLQFQKDTIEGNVAGGITTEESYLEDCKNYL